MDEGKVVNCNSYIVAEHIPEFGMLRSRSEKLSFKYFLFGQEIKLAFVDPVKQRSELSFPALLDEESCKSGFDRGQSFHAVHEFRIVFKLGHLRIDVTVVSGNDEERILHAARKFSNPVLNVCEEFLYLRVFIAGSAVLVEKIIR